MNNYTIRDDFVRFGVRKEVKKGEFICNPLLDNVSETIYFLDTGISALTSYSESGEERIHLYYGEKRVAGFSAMLSRQFFDEWSDSQSWNYLVHPDTCWITAKTDCVYYKITGSHVQELLSQSPDFMRGILSSMTRNYLELIDKLQTMVDGNRTAQFCQWLLSCQVKQGTYSVIPKTFSFVEIAKFLGMHPVTVSRLFKKFRELGAIDKVDGMIVIKNEQLLASLMHEKEE